MKDNNIGSKMAENFVKHMKGINRSKFQKPYEPQTKGSKKKALDTWS